MRQDGQPAGYGTPIVSVTLTFTLVRRAYYWIGCPTLPPALWDSGAASPLAELRMNNEQWDDSEAELYIGPFCVAFVLSVLIAAGAVLWLF